MRADVQTSLKVSCLARASSDAREWRATHVISLLDPTLPVAEEPDCRPAHHVVRRFYDAERGDGSLWVPAVTAELLKLASDWLGAPATRLLVHCHAGASRSTALSYALIAASSPDLDEAAAFALLLALTEKPWPNRAIVIAADDILGRNGRLIAPLDAYRAAHPGRIKAYGRLNRRRGLVDPTRGGTVFPPAHRAD